MNSYKWSEADVTFKLPVEYEISMFAVQLLKEIRSGGKWVADDVIKSENVSISKVSYSRALFLHCHPCGPSFAVEIAFDIL